jgi:hypothetical protein
MVEQRLQSDLRIGGTGCRGYAVEQLAGPLYYATVKGIRSRARLLAGRLELGWGA